MPGDTAPAFTGRASEKQQAGRTDGDDSYDEDVYTMMANLQHDETPKGSRGSQGSRSHGSSSSRAGSSGGLGEALVSDTPPESASSSLPEDVQDELLQHPRVQQAIRHSLQAAEAPLSDPVVQQRVLSVCMEKYPEVAEKAPNAIAGWSKDEKVQQKAKKLAGVPALATVARGFVGKDKNVVHTIEQGHPVIRMAAFLAGAASMILAIFPTIHPVELLTAPLCWVLGVYHIFFSFTTVIFEAKPQWVRRIRQLDFYQNMLLQNAGFLAKSSGRGLFYIFQGTLWLGAGYSLPGLGPLNVLYSFLTKLLGVFMLLIGLAHLLMHCGIMPQDYAPKLIRGGRRMTNLVQEAMTGLRAGMDQSHQQQQQRGARSSVVESF